MAWRGSVGSEWIKLWSMRSTWWSLASAVVLMVACAAAVGASFAHDVAAGAARGRTSMAIGEPAMNGVLLAQFAVVAFAMAVMTTEFATGAIRVTLTADPRRGRVLIAKTVVVVAVTVPLGLLLAVSGVGIGRFTLGSAGVGEGRAMARDIVVITAYLVLTAMTTVGVAAVVRGALPTLSTVLVVMLLLPVFVTARAGEYLPGGAGSKLLEGHAAAGATLAAWAFAAQLAGWRVLRRRDV
ncbi:hypothetical protein [Embleya scabrispora]|uniref:hypothetical protein n=1 Tax=Embleya scabrispora TaxID=159449 RepID=UPI00039C0F70|nr:hypothetical protein [Embleya scabrispora]MYS81631.1 hypothetical protein [Streptomyces sp. SID5474]